MLNHGVITEDTIGTRLYSQGVYILGWKQKRNIISR